MTLGDEDRSLASDPIKVKLSPVEETMVLTLRSRARDAASPNPILGDVHAQKILDRVDASSVSPTLLPRDHRYDDYITVRAKHLDQWCKAFLEEHEDEPVAVLHLACGLDLRATRVQTASFGDKVQWTDLDKPEVVNLRRRLIPDPIGATRSKSRAWDYRLIGASVSDDGSWMDEIPQDRPLLIIAEGLFPYLEPEDAMGLLRRLVKHASSGQIVMDTVGTILMRYTSLMPLFRGTSVRMRWGVDDGEEVAKAHPRLRLAETVLFEDLLPGMFASAAPPCLGILTPVFWLLPLWRTYGMLLRLEF
ncbi:S-adenosyl-L-methionine-dependent methyltransferase [Astrocystis sublimbata]|nr:S-adenosyl-L-methionine-dependent methyltransferase [Astrocystis sublimbata]